MSYQQVKEEGNTYIEVTGKTVISAENDVNDLIGNVFSIETSRVLIDGEALGDDFFDLKTGLAGTMLQKLINYHIKAAVFISKGKELKERFKELMSELNKGNDFRFFYTKEEAKNWLLEK